jgi:hypothetical protein
VSLHDDDVVAELREQTLTRTGACLDDVHTSVRSQV